MVFDLATAKAEEKTGFDLSTATPEGSGSGFTDSALNDINRLNENPGNREFMFVPGRNVNVDLPKGGINRTWELMRRSFNVGDKTTELGTLASGVIFGDKSPETEEKIKKLQKSLEGPDPVIGILPPPQEGWVNYIATAISEQIPNLLGMAHEGIETGTAAGATTMAATALAGPAAPAVAPLVPISFGGGFATGSLNYAFNQIAGSSYLEYRDFTDKEGNKLPDDMAKLGAVMSGVIGTGLEALPFGLLAKIMPGASKIFQKAGVRATEALKFPTTTQAMKTFLFNIAKVAAAEGITESLQEVVQIETGEALKAFAQGEFEPVSTGDMWARIQEAGLKGAIVGGGISIPVAGARAVSDVAQSKAATKALERGVKEASEEGQVSETEAAKPTEIKPEVVAEVTKEIEDIVGATSTTESTQEATGLSSDITDNVSEGTIQIIKAGESAKIEGKDFIVSITPSTKKSGKKFQLTVFTKDNIPTSDNQFDTFEEAVKNGINQAGFSTKDQLQASLNAGFLTKEELTERELALVEGRIKGMKDPIPDTEDTSFEFGEAETIAKVNESLEAIAPSQETRETLLRGRVAAVNKDILAIDKEIDSLEKQIVQKKLKKPAETTKSLEKKIDKLLIDREVLDVERDNLLIVGLANNLKLKKAKSPLAKKKQKADTEKAIKSEEAGLMIEELEKGTAPEKVFITDDFGVVDPEQVSVAKSTNPPYLFGDLDIVGLKQGGKKINRRRKKTVVAAIRRVMEDKPSPADPASAALHQRILDLIEDRLNDEQPRFAPGTGASDPFRGNSVQNIAELQAERGDTTVEELFNSLLNKDILRDADIDTSKDILIKGEKIVKLEERSLKDQASALAKGLREGARLAKKDIKQAIKNTKQLIRDSSLPKDTKDAIIAQFVTGEADFIKNIPKLKSKIANEFERLAVKEQKARINKSLSRKTLKPKVVSGVKQGKFDAEIQTVLENLSELNKTEGRVNPDTGESAASELLDSRISDEVNDPLGNAVLNMKANPRDVTSAELRRLADILDILLSEGREAAKARVLSRQVAVDNAAIQINSHVTGGENIQAWQRTGTKGAFRKASQWVQQAVSRLVDGWDEVVLRIVPGRQASTFEIGIEIQKEKGVKRRMSNKLVAAAAKAFGVKEGRKLQNILESSNEVVDHGLFINAAGKEVRLELSVSQARKLFMEWQDTTLRETLTSETGNAFTDEMLTFIFNSVLGEQDKVFAQEQLQIYAEFYDEINEVYRRVFGVNLDKNEFYSPIRREVDGQEIGLDEFGADIRYRAKVATNPSLKARQKSIQPIMQRSDIAVFNQHIMAMSRFIALREKTQFLNSVFGRAEVRRNLEARYGKDFNLFVGEHLESFVNGANRASDILSKSINFFNRNFAAAQLGAKAKIGFTQTVSYFAYAEFVPVKEFISGTRDFFLHMPAAIKTLSASELLKDRGFSQDVEIARLGRTFDNAFIKRIQKKQDKMIDYMLIATKIGDRLPIFVGGWAVYKHVLKKTGSKVKAMQAFERATAKTQQSTDQDQLSLAQKTNPLMRGLTMFMSAPIAQFRGETRAVRQLLKGESSARQFAKSMLIYHFILPGLYQALSNGLIFGEWDKDDQIRAAILGSFNGIPIMGDIMNSTIRTLQGKGSRGTEVLKWTKPMVEMIGDLFEAMEAGKEGDFEELAESIYDSFKNSGSLTGLPAPQIDNIQKGFRDLDNGDLKSSTLRFLGWPSSVADNIE